MSSFSCHHRFKKMRTPFHLIFLPMMFSPIHAVYLKMSSSGFEFQPRHPIQLLIQMTLPTRLRCAVACSQLPACRTIDFDSASRRCRLFEGDLTTGSEVPSTSTTSVVGKMIFSPSMFAQSHARPCQACQDSRYEVCDANTTTCQCRPHTFLDNSICAMQLFANDTCSQVGSCRSDLNLTCPANFIGKFLKCASRKRYSHA